MTHFQTIPHALNNLVVLNIIMVSTVGLSAGVALYLFAGPMAVIVTTIFAAVLSWFMFKKK